MHLQKCIVTEEYNCIDPYYALPCFEDKWNGMRNENGMQLQRKCDKKMKENVTANEMRDEKKMECNCKRNVKWNVTAHF